MAVKLFLEPLDTLFFRDSRPFTAGEDDFADSVLPSPLTIYGAIGSYYLETQGFDVNAFINPLGTNISDLKLGRYSQNIEKTGFTIQGPFLSLDKKPYFPAPANLWVSGFDKKTPHILKPYDKIDGKKCDLNGVSPMTIGPKSDLELEPLSGYLSIEDIQTYLFGGKIPWRLNPRYESDFFIKEPRIGHHINPLSYTVKKGMLYSSRHLRFIDNKYEQNRYKKASLLVVINTLDPSDFTSKAYCIGGEKKGVMVEAIQNTTKLIPEMNEVIDKIKESKRFFLYLATPAIFKKGWHRDWPADFKDSKFVGAAVNKPQFISGWKRHGLGMQGEPRHIKRLAPAGSVYFFNINNWNEDEFKSLYKKYHFGESLSEEYPDAGFGIALIGVW